MSYLAKLVKRLSVVWAIVVVGGACGDGPSGATAAGPTPTLDVIASVRVLPESLEVHVGESLRFTAELRNARGQLLLSEPVVWSTSDSTVAAVDSSGTLIALQVGDIQVRASSREKFGSARLRIRPAPVAMVSTTPSTASLAVGETLRIEARTYSAAGNRLFGGSVTWSSSAPGVATVDATGLVTARAVGSALISAQSEGRVGASQVQITGPTAVPLPGAVDDLRVVSVTDTTATLRFTEVANGLGAASNYEIRFAVAPISWGTATVASGGSCAAPVVGSGVGLTRTCTLRGLDPSTAYEYQIRAFRGTGADAVLGPESNVVGSTTNQVAVATVTLDPTTASTPVGQTRSYTATVRDAAGNAILGRTLTWSSTGSGVASVSSAGVATALVIGSTTIRASTSGRTGSASLSVTAAAQSPVATVVLAPGSDTVSVGQSATYQATLRDSAGSVLTGRPVAWSSTNTAVATVTGAGVVTGNSVGSATIRATSEGRIGSATMLVVAAAPVPVASVTVAPGSATVSAGQGVSFATTVRDANGNILTGRVVTWSSSNSMVASVSSSGYALGSTQGATTIVATSEGRTGSATLTVSAVSPPPSGLLVAANWGTATGNSVAAVTDGGKGIARWCDWQQALSVTSGGAVNWTRTSNVLRIRSIGGCGHVEFENVFPRPTSQQQFWAVRYYMMNGVGQTDTKMHPHTHWPVGSIEAVHTQIWTTGGNGNWRHGSVWGVQSYNHPNGTGGPDFPWYPMASGGQRVLTAGTWYRYEYIVHWLDATRYRVYPRLYDTAGNLLNDHTNWQHSDGAGTMSAYYAAGGYFTRRSGSGSGVDNIRTFSFGMGQAGSSNQYYYVADAVLALVSGASDFIGSGAP